MMPKSTHKSLNSVNFVNGLVRNRRANVHFEDFVKGDFQTGSNLKLKTK